MLMDVRSERIEACCAYYWRTRWDMNGANAGLGERPRTMKLIEVAS